MKAVLAGTGWRSRFYLRIASLLPDLLEIVSVFTSSKERAGEYKAKGYNCYSSLDEALSFKHDAVIVSTGEDSFCRVMKELGKRDEFILSETSFLSLSEEEKASLSRLKGAVMEQYPYDPIFSALVNIKDRVGVIDQIFISGLHNHHSAALFKAISGVSSEKPEEVISFDYPSAITKTGARDTIINTNEKEDYVRKLRILKFAAHLFIHDFSSNQYHNYLFPKRIEIRGDKGVLSLDGLKTTDASGYVVDIPFVVHRDTSTWNSNMTISHITLADEVVYVNPFYPVNLNDDEIGIATIIRNICDGKGYRTIKDGIDDAVLGEML